jgi:hypothetical protein
MKKALLPVSEASMNADSPGAVPEEMSETHPPLAWL